MINEFKQVKTDNQEQFNEYRRICLNTRDHSGASLTSGLGKVLSDLKHRAEAQNLGEAWEAIVTPWLCQHAEIWNEFNVVFRAKGREQLKLQSSSLGTHDSSRSVREGDQLKLQSSSLRAHDSSRSVNLRACAGLPQNRDEPSWGEGEASRSACLRVVDSGEDPELHETPGVSSTDPLTENAGKNRGGNFDQDSRDDFAVDDEKTTDIETWVIGKLPAQNQWQLCPHDAGQALWQAAGQRRHQHHRRTNKLVGTASVDLSGPHQGTPMIGGKVGSRQGHYFVVLHLRPDRSVGHKSIATQTISEDDPAAGEIPDAAAEEADSLMPLLYAEVLSHKADASAGVQRLLARARDDHGHLPNHVVFRCHSDRGQEFLNRSLEKYCEEHAIRRTTTQGYDPSANGAGENAVGHLKRKARQLLMGSRLPSFWW